MTMFTSELSNIQVDCLNLSTSSLSGSAEVNWQEEAEGGVGSEEEDSSTDDVISVDEDVDVIGSFVVEVDAIVVDAVDDVDDFDAVVDEVNDVVVVLGVEFVDASAIDEDVALPHFTLFGQSQELVSKLNLSP